MPSSESSRDSRSNTVPVLAGALAAVASLALWVHIRDRQRTRSDFTVGNEIYIPSRHDEQR